MDMSNDKIHLTRPKKKLYVFVNLINENEPFKTVRVHVFFLICNFLSDGALFKNAYKTHAQTAIYVFI